ncbi:MAG TPA: phasin family protein [Pseudomonadales bacterium]|nr:phasin family protein [Pseudomonadales bacterium]
MGDNTLDSTFLNEFSLKAKEASQEVRKFYQLLWHAGLGAVVKLEQESSKLFADLVKEGEKQQSRLQREMSKKSKLLPQDSAFSLDTPLRKLEAVVEKGLQLLMERFGIPAKSELDALSARIESLNKSVGSLAAKRAKA